MRNALWIRCIVYTSLHTVDVGGPTQHRPKIDWWCVPVLGTGTTVGDILPCDASVSNRLYDIRQTENTKMDQNENHREI